MSSAEEGMPVRGPGKQPSSAPLCEVSRRSQGGALLDCAVRRMSIFKRKIRGVRSSARDPARQQKKSFPAWAVQRRELVRHANALKENRPMRQLHPRKRTPEVSVRVLRFLRSSVFPPQKKPNKALEPTRLLALSCRKPCPTGNARGRVAHL